MFGLRGRKERQLWRLALRMADRIEFESEVWHTSTGDEPVNDDGNVAPDCAMVDAGASGWWSGGGVARSREVSLRARVVVGVYFSRHIAKTEMRSAL